MTLDQQGTLLPAYSDTDHQATEFVLTFGFEKPPLRKDDRLGRTLRAQLTQHVVTSTMWEARRLPMLTGPVTVELAWNVNDGISRIPERMRPTLDAMLVGLVNADVLLADEAHLRTSRLVVNVLDKTTNPKPHLTLTITKDHR